MNVGVAVRLLDEEGRDLGMVVHIPVPIEIDDLVATERRDVSNRRYIAPSTDASVIAARCRVTPVRLPVAAR